MNVLSLFDGMSCGQIALREAGIKVDKYFASEIETQTQQPAYGSNNPFGETNEKDDLPF